MARRGELKPMDEFEEGIRARAVCYNLVCFKPGTSSKVKQTVDTIDEAVVEAGVILGRADGVRSVMVYAVDEAGHFALVGTMNQGSPWKPVVVRRY